MASAPTPDADDAATRKERAFDKIALLLLGIVSIGYFFVAIDVARSVPFWMDEVLAVWTARLPSLGAIWIALKDGAEFSPPLFHWLLHGIIRSGGDSRLLLRAPSILAVYFVGIAAFVLTRRRSPTPIAALAMAACLTGGLFPYAWEARPYACVAACFAFALVAWDIPAERAPSRARATAICAALSIAVGLHFYAVLLVGTLGLMELAWSAKHRRIRILHMLAIALAAFSIAVWEPIIASVSKLNQADVAAADYYAKPILGRLIDAYAKLLEGHDVIGLSPLAMLLIVLALNALMEAKRKGVARKPASRNDDLDLIIKASWAFPAIVFLFALVVTHTFSARYAIASCLGMSIYLARLVARLPASRPLCCILLAATAAAAFSPSLTAGSPPWTESVFANLPPNLPIVTGNGMRFFEIRESKIPVSPRLVYLSAPASAHSDQTNDRQTLRWSRIEPSLPIENARAFLQTHARFLVFRDDCNGADALPSFLNQSGFAMKEISRAGCDSVSEAALTHPSDFSSTEELGGRT